MIRSEEKLDDRTRLLLTIIWNLSMGQPIWPEEKWLDYRGVVQPHFSTNGFSSERLPHVGDLVLAKSSGIHEATVGYVESAARDYVLVRGIGSNKRVRISNDWFETIVGIPPEQLWEGEQQAFYWKVRKAFKRGGDYSHRYDNIRFALDVEGRPYATILFYEPNYRQARTRDYFIFECTMYYTKRTTIKEILERLREAGYGDKELVARTYPGEI